MKKTTIPDTTQDGMIAIDPNEYVTITIESFIKKYGKAAEKFIADVQRTERERFLEIIKQEPNPYYKNRVFCDCPCKGPYCNNFVHQCDKPEIHYSQREQAIIDIRNELRAELKKKVNL